MKRTRKLIPAFAMLMVAAIMLSTASYAWFTMGTQVTASGMSVQATASSTLVIIDGDVNDGPTVNNFLMADGSITFGAREGMLIPATHDDNKETYANCLKTVADSRDVDDADGLYSGDNYAPTTEDTHYFEYVAMIGATGSALPHQDLTATIKLPANVAALINNAVTIDFWVSAGKANPVEYKTKANLLAVDAANDNALTITLAEDINIPLVLEDENTVGDYITVTMRVYFDGALVCESGANKDKAYVRNALVSEIAAEFSVNFDVVAHPTTPAQGGGEAGE